MLDSDRPQSRGGRYRRLRICSAGGGFEAVPDRDLRLDLRRVASALEAHGVGVIDARVMLIAGMQPEVTIARSGRLLFKTADAPTAERAFQQLRAWAELPPME
jgi:hypothetical protein